VPRGLQLFATEGSLAGTKRTFAKNPLVIGRGDDCDLEVPDPGVSRKHCRIGWEGSNYFVEDLGSLNGTRVNGSLVKKHWLSHGDAISMGALMFRFTDVAVPRQAFARAPAARR